MTLAGSGAAGSVTLGASGNLGQPTLRITDPGGPSTLTSAAGFTNHGKIVLETSAGYGDTLAITSGTLTNAADGSIDINYGVGGPATISGQVVNDGSVTVAAGATLNISGQVVNDGAFTIASGATVSMTGGAPTFDQAGGTLADSSAIPVSGPTFTYHGGTITGAVVLSAATLALAAPAASPDTFILEGSANVLASDVPAGHTLLIQRQLQWRQHAHERGRLHQPRHDRARLGQRLRGHPRDHLGRPHQRRRRQRQHQLRRRRPDHHQRPGRQRRQRHDRQRGDPAAGGGRSHASTSTAAPWTVDGSFPVTGATFTYHGGTIPSPLVLSGATLDLAASAASPDTFVLDGAQQS